MEYFTLLLFIKFYSSMGCSFFYYIGNVSSMARKLSILDVSPLQDVILMYKLYICGVNVNKVNKGFLR